MQNGNIEIGANVLISGHLHVDIQRCTRVAATVNEVAIPNVGLWSDRVDIGRQSKRRLRFTYCDDAFGLKPTEQNVVGEPRGRTGLCVHVIGVLISRMHQRAITLGVGGFQCEAGNKTH